MFSLLITYLALLGAALLPIYTGAHASLTRPASAAEAVPRLKSGRGAERDSDSEDEDAGSDERARSSKVSLTLADAVWFPLLGGILLLTIYLLIRYMDDPALLSRILNVYFAVVGTSTLGSLLADALALSVSLLFPRCWSAGPTVWYASRGDHHYVSESKGWQTTSASPLPGRLSKLPLTALLCRRLWALRTTLDGHGLLRIDVAGKALVRAVLPVKEVLGFGAAMGLAVLYLCLGSQWWLMNAFALGSSYTVLEILTPKTFKIGTAVLASLFCYDIYMVFYTPLMSTVAQTLDVPIKFVVPRTSGPGSAMLGLGDVVLPGMMIALALKFDLHRFYLRKQTKRMSPSVPATDESDGQVGSEPRLEMVKAPYHQATGGWGEWVWTSSDHAGHGLRHVLPETFPKPYFHASLVGYVLGMMVTFGILTYTHHPQPALLYLVPGVLLAVWGTAWVKGDVKEMWDYSELTEEATDDRSENESKAAAPLDAVPSKERGSGSQPASRPTSSSGPVQPEKVSRRWPDQKLFAVLLSFRTPPAPRKRPTTSATLDPHIVEDIRDALNSDMELRRRRASKPGSPRTGSPNKLRL
ncbi:MAG: hypothetical protein M1826_001322 [Phylliscum demangeonii]|nr:MAG: hypothetical protein M1826_001322 [Phylliscum demangeonii]